MSKYPTVFYAPTHQLLQHFPSVGLVRIQNKGKLCCTRLLNISQTFDHIAKLEDRIVHLQVACDLCSGYLLIIARRGTQVAAYRSFLRDLLRIFLLFSHVKYSFAPEVHHSTKLLDREGVLVLTL